MTMIRSGLSPGNIPGNATIGGKVTSYNGTATAGSGVSPIRAATPIAGVATSTNNTSVATLTPAAVGIFEVGGHFEVTAYTSGNVGLMLSYTDANGNARSFNMGGQSQAGTYGTTAAATGMQDLFTQTICANPASIALQASITGTATATFWGHIKQVE